jgi:hypothetical protein
VLYNATDNTATFTTTSPISKATTVTVIIKGGTSGATDADGVQLDSNGDGKLDGSDGDKVFSFTVASTITKTLSLAAGWNLISFPIEPINTSISTLFKDIANNILIIWAYPGQIWKFYDPKDEEGSTLTTMESGKGYWVKTNNSAETTITGNVANTSTALLFGWNLVGFSKSSKTSATDVLNGISNKYSIMWAYPGQVWKFYDPKDVEGSTQTDFNPGIGYWIKTTEATVWTLP